MFPLNAASLIYKDQLIITGGNYDRTDKFLDETHRYYLKIGDDNRVKATRDENFPMMNKARSHHSAFVYKDYLFVMFGKIQNDIEYLDLTSPNPKFKTIPFRFHLDFERPMICLNNI